MNENILVSKVSMAYFSQCIDFPVYWFWRSCLERMCHMYSLLITTAVVMQVTLDFCISLNTYCKLPKTIFGGKAWRLKC